MFCFCIMTHSNTNLFPVLECSVQNSLGQLHIPHTSTLLETKSKVQGNIVFNKNLHAACLWNTYKTVAITVEHFKVFLEMGNGQGGSFFVVKIIIILFIFQNCGMDYSLWVVCRIIFSHTIFTGWFAKFKSHSMPQFRTNTGSTVLLMN